MDQLPRLGKREITCVSVCCCLPVIMWLLFGEVSSSSGCLGWATLFYSLSLPYNYFIFPDPLGHRVYLELF